MKNSVFISVVMLSLVGCSSQSEQSSQAIYDMKTVQEYNARVISGNTVTQTQKDKITQQIDTSLKLNQSDNKVKTRTRRVLPVLPVTPSVGYHYNYHYFR
ncbi:hypothetical protein MY682_01930 [Haemophilus influenzae]|uniref:UDP-N-acetylglucosamine 1-carboxyvinyltransferase n=1 Tax=Haemophilus influenzae TaxID=727 RepID=A0AAX3IR76_HAEIF|nr:hypothetical protein [Haemophilus influenzae]KMZ25638.1 hypothetical protein ABN52_01115 [Haemophilus influenzae]MCK8807668.1 hypothetical protein [Haemophilus influenzae]MCK8882012.1 hypothetical protein [Haemophilus influenzae]MCK9069201.1 hypothetical protein [Haemophilus influenzae]OMQ00844.1 hypothetical protein BV935_00830 [Haemophilus influenzae]